jgi:hypothetical protein
VREFEGSTSGSSVKILQKRKRETTDISNLRTLADEEEDEDCVNPKEDSRQARLKDMQVSLISSDNN